MLRQHWRRDYYDKAGKADTLKMVGSASTLGFESTRSVMLTICRSVKQGASTHISA